MPRAYLPAPRTVDDLRARCTVNADTGCWAWTGRFFGGVNPAIPLAGTNGAVSLQIALAVLTTGARMPSGRWLIPTCGNLPCLNPAHRREGSRSELHALVASNRKPHALTDEGRARIAQAVRESWQRRKAGQAPKPKPKPKPRKAQAPKPEKPARGPKLHDMLDPMGAQRGVPMTGLRKAGSSARPIPAQRPQPTEPQITSATRITVCPSGADHRYTVRELPPGHRSVLNPRECSPWAEAAAGGRGA